MKDDVYYGRSDPNSDPCGYRTVLCAKLADEFYNIAGLSNELLSKDMEYMRPKASDLLALLEINAVDYIFEYKSVAEQHNLPYVVFSDSINLKSPDLSNWYSSKSVDIAGKKPGDYISMPGEPIVYGLTILSDAKNKLAAELFVLFMLNDNRGREIMARNSNIIIDPIVCSQPMKLPEALKILLP